MFADVIEENHCCYLQFFHKHIIEITIHYY